jgi:hypothetical protein
MLLQIKKPCAARLLMNWMGVIIALIAQISQCAVAGVVWGVTVLMGLCVYYGVIQYFRKIHRVL